MDLRLLHDDKNKMSYEDFHDREACAFPVVYYDKNNNNKFIVNILKFNYFWVPSFLIFEMFG